ncbi:MAG: class I SAM-dependent methyltransferase, partial [Actinomycetota bacterium]
RSEFDAEFFRRFYSTTPMHSRKKIESLARAVHGLCAWWDLPIKSVLEVGAGVGYWSDWYRRTHKKVRVVSVDVSEHACRKYGHQLRDISRWSPRTKFDLVICQSVLQYLGDQEARRAITNLARSTKNLLYFEVPTKQDLRLTVDRTVTDLEIYSRDGAWYQSELNKNFRQIGAGLWVAKTSSIVLYELEAARSNRKT